MAHSQNAVSSCRAKTLENNSRKMTAAEKATARRRTKCNHLRERQTTRIREWTRGKSKRKEGEANDDTTTTPKQRRLIKSSLTRMEFQTKRVD